VSDKWNVSASAKWSGGYPKGGRGLISFIFTDLDHMYYFGHQGAVKTGF